RSPPMNVPRRRSPASSPRLDTAYRLPLRGVEVGCGNAGQRVAEVGPGTPPLVRRDAGAVPQAGTRSAHLDARAGLARAVAWAARALLRLVARAARHSGLTQPRPQGARGLRRLARGHR